MTLLYSQWNKRTTRILCGSLAAATVVIAIATVVGILFLVGYLKMPTVASPLQGLPSDRDAKSTIREQDTSIRGRSSDVVGPDKVVGSGSEASYNVLLKSLLVQAGYINAEGEVTKPTEPFPQTNISSSVSLASTSSLLSDKTQTARPMGEVALARKTPAAEETPGGTRRNEGKTMTPPTTTAGRILSANSNNNSNSASNSTGVIGQLIFAGVSDAKLEAQFKQLYPGGYKLDRPWDAQKGPHIRQPAMDELEERHTPRPVIEGYQYAPGTPALPYIARNYSVVFDEPEIVPVAPINKCPYEVAPKICEYRRENRILNAGKCDEDHPCQDVAATCCHLECQFESVCVHKSFFPVVQEPYL